MPIFRTTKDIFQLGEEGFNPNYLNYTTLVLPPNPSWDYSREMKIEDVDLWEVIYEQGGKVAVYAAWCPYAEFYLVRVGWWLEDRGYGVETYYGKGAQEMVQKRMKEMGIPFGLNKVWVEPELMYLYEK